MVGAVFVRGPQRYEGIRRWHHYQSAASISTGVHANYDEAAIAIRAISVPS